ncbi:MAG: FAD-binding protein, partial [Cyanobacteria bacterium J06648_11]
MTATVLKPSQRQWDKLARQFEAIVGQRFVVRRREELMVYECDGLTSYRQRPALVVLPRTTEEVAQVLEICDRDTVPFVARGAGTGLSGGALPIEDCVLVTTARMQQIVDIDYDNRRIVVQPGVINQWVTQAVSGNGFYYAPDPSSQSVCTV